MSPELKTAIQISRHLNKLLMRRFLKFDFSLVEYKKDREIVTYVDRESNQYIIKKLLKKFPAYDIVSEESPLIDNADNKRWFIDPLDGTTNFAYGISEFSTCIGLENSGDIMLGVIGEPKMSRIFYAEKNKGAWCGKQKIKVSKTNTLDRAMHLICRGHSPEGKRRFAKFLQKVDINKGSWRMLSSAGIELSSIASGRADICILANIQPWDVVAGVILIREAGGVVTNFQGETWTLADKTLVASNGLVHEQMIEITKEIK